MEIPLKNKNELIIYVHGQNEEIGIVLDFWKRIPDILKVGSNDVLIDVVVSKEIQNVRTKGCIDDENYNALGTDSIKKTVPVRWSGV